MLSFSLSTRPASFSLAMWCEIVDWLSSRSAVKSQMQIGDFAFQRAATIVSRVGSASAFMRLAASSAHSTSTTGSTQHSPRCRRTGSCFSATDRSYTTHRQSSMPCASMQPIDIYRWAKGDSRMSEVREAVRSRYANVAKQLVVFNQTGSGPEGCCQADGPDCGCSGSYSAEALQEIGLTESVSLGCGNPTMLAELKPGESVLDLGSGGGLDVLLSARRVAPGGHAYGLDMTDEMLALANG